MLSRRDFLQVAVAAATISSAPDSISQTSAKQQINQNDLLKFKSTGQVTLLNFTDCHAQLVPLYFREPSINIGVGAAMGLPPHLTGDKLLKHFGLFSNSPEAYALTSENFTALSRDYGRVGGFDRMATLIKSIRADRPNNTLLLDGGDTWQGSFTALKTSAEDMVQVMNALGVDAMTGHWEFTHGDTRVLELIDKLNFPFLAGNIRDTEWQEPVFDAISYFERGGINIAVIGQAFPYTPIANPNYLMPNWSFGIQEAMIRKRIEEAKTQGADLIVFLSHNGFDVDRKLASRIDGIDVIFTGHTHDAIPRPIKVNNTLLVASGSHGKFLARLDVDVHKKRVSNYQFKLIPIFSDAIEVDPEMENIIKKIRAPFLNELNQEIGVTDTLLYRRGNFNGSFDDLICNALIEERDAEIALSPGFRWGASLIPGQKITLDSVYSQTAITYPNVYRTEMTGEFLKLIMEDVADNIFNSDPYYQQGGDMVRVGGMSYTINIHKKIGQRINNMVHLKSGKPIEPKKTYIVSGWASVNEGTEGPAIYDLLIDHIKRKKVINLPKNDNIKVISG